MTIDRRRRISGNVRRWLWITGAVIGALALVTAVTWPGVPFAIAVLLSERIPAPLGDQSEWGVPSPAFSARFAPGTSEQALLEWLKANSFEINAGHAERTIKSLPCNEHAVIAWSTDAAGKLIKASGTLNDAGCL